MGGNSSKSTVDQTNEFFNKTTNTFMDSLNQTVSSTGDSIQSINLSGAHFQGCRVNASQLGEQTVTASGTLTITDQSNLLNTLSGSANTAIDNMATQKSGFLAPSVKNSAEARTNLKNKVTNIIDNTMKSETVQSIFAHARANQNVDASNIWMECDPKYKIAGEYDLNIDQKMLQSITAKALADKLTSQLASNQEIASAVTGVKQSSTQETKGLDDLVKAIFSGLASIWGIIGALVCCVCIAILIFALSPAGQKATTNASGAGASIARARYGG
jgi:hypothetical protein